METLTIQTKSQVSPSEQLSNHPQQEAEQRPGRHGEAASSPPLSATSSPPKSPTVSDRRSTSPLAIDLSGLPGLTQPSPPSNTLIITQLDDLTIFHPASLATIRQHLISIAPLYSFSPLKSFQRIICSFYDNDSAIRVRQHLDGANVLGSVRARVYFGEPTPIGEQTKFLNRPDAGRLFFISPPPSPPVGWEVREEGPPNTDVHASDLADALGKLKGKIHNPATDPTELSPISDQGEKASDENSAENDTTAVSKTSHLLDGASSVQSRSRSSTVIYDPEAHGDSPGLPAVILHDTTIEDADEDMSIEASLAGPVASDSDHGGKSNILHTSRPPVELMETA